MSAEDHLETQVERLQAKGGVRAEKCASIDMNMENAYCLSSVPLSPLSNALPVTREPVKVGKGRERRRGD